MNSNETLAARLEKVSKVFLNKTQRTVALDQMNLQIKKKEILFIVGPSGCGKTTLLSILSGILQADEGEIEVFGEKLRTLSSQKLARFRSQKIGFIFQQFNLIPTLSVFENVALPLRIHGSPLREINKKTKSILEQFGIEEKSQLKPQDLSGGQQQRIAIARALIHQPPLIICDEPTSSLDSKNGLQIMEALKNAVHQHQQTILVVTHDPRIYSYADRIIEMEDGKMVRELKPPLFTENP